MSKQTVYKKETLIYPGPQPVPLNPASRDRISELYKIVYELNKRVNSSEEGLNEMKLTIDNFVPKEMDIAGTWNVGETTPTTAGTLHVKILKDSVTVTGSVPAFEYVNNTAPITFTSEDSLPEESADSKLVEKSIVLTSSTAYDPFIITVNASETVILSFAPPTIPADTAFTATDLSITYTSASGEDED